MVTTNLFTHPVFKDGGVHQQRPRRAPLRAAQGDAQHRPGRRARRRDLRALGRPRGRRVRRGQGRPRRARPLPRGPRHCWRQYVIDQGYGLRFAIEPKPNEPRGDILLPTVGHALAFISDARAPRAWSASTPRSATSRWPGSTSRTASPRRCGTGKLFHIDLNGQRGIKYDQDLVFGHGDLLNAFCLVDLLENGGPDGGPAYDGPRHFDYKPLAHRGHRRRLGLGRGEHAHLPAAQGAGGGVPGRPGGAGGAGRQPGRRARRRRRSAAGETYADLLADRRRFEDFDAEAAAARGLRLRRSSTSSPSSTCSARAERGSDAARRRGRLVDPVLQGRRPRRRRPARWCAQGRAPHPDGTEVDPAAWWAALRHGVDRGRRARRRRRGRRRRPAARHGAASTTTARSSGPRCCGTTPARPAAAADLVAELGGRRRGPTRSASCRSPRSPSPSCAGSPSTSRRTPRATAAVCLPHDWLTWRLAGAPALDAPRHRPRRRQRHRLLVAGAPGEYRPDLLERALGARRRAAPGARPGRARPGRPPTGRGARAGRRRQRRRRARPRRAAGRRRRLDRHLRASSCAVRRRCRPPTPPARSPASPTPPARFLPLVVHPQRRPGARRRRRAARRRPRRARRAGAVRARPGRTGWCWCPTSRASAPRTGPTPPARCTA